MAWNRSNNSRQTETTLRRARRSRPTGWIALGGVCVVLGTVVAWWIWPGGESAGETPTPQTKQRIREVTPAAPPKAKVAVAREEKAAVERPARKSGTVKYADEESREAAARRQRHADMWAKKLKTDKRLQHYLKNFKPVEQDFKSTTEQVLDRIFNAKVGENPPVPLPPLSQFEIDHIDEVLDAVNEIKDTDDERLAERKRVVDEVKREMKDYLAQGGTVREFLEHYHAELERTWEIKATAQHSVEEMISEGDNDLSKQYLKKVNKLLEVQGIPEIELNEREREILGDER